MRVSPEAFRWLRQNWPALAGASMLASMAASASLALWLDVRDKEIGCGEIVFAAAVRPFFIQQAGLRGGEMPTNMTFSNLFDDVTKYLERGGSYVTDQTVFEQIPRLINGAERKLAQDLKLLGQIEVFSAVPPSGGLQASNPVLAKPDRWRRTISLGFGSGTSNNTYAFLNGRSYEYLLAYWPDSTATGTPQFYADVDYQHWWIAPTPDAAYPIRARCYMQPALLSEEQQTNFWTDYTPNALLYGALIEAEAFIKEDPRVPLWKDLWTTELATLGLQDLQRVMDGAAERTGP